MRGTVVLSSVLTSVYIGVLFFGPHLGSIQIQLQFPTYCPPTNSSYELMSQSNCRRETVSSWMQGAFFGGDLDVPRRYDPLVFFALLAGVTWLCVSHLGAEEKEAYKDPHL